MRTLHLCFTPEHTGEDDGDGDLEVTSGGLNFDMEGAIVWVSIYFNHIVWVREFCV
jgi:hypothetical protein